MKIFTHVPVVGFLFLCILLLPAQKIMAQVSGVKTIPGDYASITDAIAQIRIAGVSGPVFLELQPGYTSSGETFPITIREIPGISAVNSLTISPASGTTGLSIISANSGPVIELIGAYNIIIDGRPGRIGSARELTVRNNATAGNAISFVDGAIENFIKYCNLEGSSTSVYRGIVYFGPSFGPLPVNTLFENAGNEISNCIIKGINSPEAAIFATGIDPVHNFDNKIINNEIIMTSGYGIEMYNFNSHWIISGNSIYSPTGLAEFGILFGPSAPGSVNNTISGNYIGGTAPQASGSKALVFHSFHGIILYSGTFIVENNVIQNFRIRMEGGQANFEGMRIFDNASAQINGNQFGGIAPSNNIQVDAGNFTLGSATIRGITNLSCLPVAITNNRISNILFFGYTTAIFTGIWHNGGDNLVIAGNQIDQISANGPGSVLYKVISLTPNPICPVSPNPSAEIDRNLINNITLSSDDGNSTFTGIELNGTSVSSEATLLHNNEIYKINVSSPNDEASFTGITINDRIAGNTGNIIGSATEANSIMVTGKTASANGIRLNNSPDVSISDDIIANITANGTLTPASVNGILFNGGALAKISGNNIHHLTSPQSKGIFIQPSNGSSTVTIEKNILTGINTNTGTGIETFVASEASLNLTATDNTISNWQTGVLLAAANGATLVQSFQNNSVVNNQTGFINENGTAVNATCNWWGHASGPSGAGPGTGNPVGPNVIFSPWATIENYVAINAGADQTIYMWYGPTSKTITPSVTVCGTPTFLWSTGATTLSITVSPTVTTVYTVKIIDGNGHEATDEITVFVLDVRCGNNNNKVMVCHKESLKKSKILCISSSDVASHLGHGDELGDCNGGNASRNFTGGAAETKMNPEGLLEQQSTLKVFPNPTFSHIQLQWVAAFTGTAKLTIIDVLGRTVFTQNVVQTKGSNNRRILLPPVKKGNYIMLFQSGGKISTEKIFIQH
ncbi:MAG: T9SS type A sorting domain-containing protein [Chitinophagaceae bacterium]